MTDYRLTWRDRAGLTLDALSIVTLGLTGTLVILGPLALLIDDGVFEPLIIAIITSMAVSLVSLGLATWLDAPMGDD